MTATQSDETRMLRETAASFVAAHFPMDRVRRLAEEPSGIGAAQYDGLTAQGWLGILVPEEHGGLGLGISELAIVLEELGRALVPGPFWSAATLGVPLVATTRRERIRSTWLDPVTTGEMRITLALQEDGGLPTGDRIRTVAHPAGGERFVLQGVKRFVPDLAGADGVVVVAKAPEGPLAFLIRPDTAGASVEEQRVADVTSRSGTLRLDSVEAGREDLIGDWGSIERVFQFGAVGIAAMAVAGAQALLDQTLGYVKHRVQFGVPIGTFQAVQHPLVNLLGEIESARSAYLYAAWAVDHGAPDASRAVALARLTATSAYRHAATACLQAHGGIAFTWEYDLHLHLKRAIHLDFLLGTADDYREIVAREGLGI